MKITTWNANGVSRKNNQAKVDWLLTYLQLNPDIAVLALQETHCQDDSEYSQALHDIKLMTEGSMEDGLLNRLID